MIKNQEYIRCKICKKKFKPQNLGIHMFWKHPTKEQEEICKKERKKRSERQKGDKNVAKRKDVRTKISEKAKLRIGNKNSCWKGNEASYECKHVYMKKHIEIPKKCFICGKLLEIRKIELMNLDHKYNRNLVDTWKWAHVSCHREYDKIHNEYQLNKQRDKLGRFIN